MAIWSGSTVLPSASVKPMTHHQQCSRRVLPMRSPSPILSTANPKPQRVAKFICFVVHRTWPNRPANNGQAHPSFLAFVSRVVRMSGVTSTILFLSLLYIIRLRQATKVASLSQFNSATSAFDSPEAVAEARLVTAAVILAQKITDDNRFTNKTWSELTGFALPDINRMESEFLSKIDFKLHVTEQEYRSWVRSCTSWAQQMGAGLEESPARGYPVSQRYSPPLSLPPQPMQQQPLPGYYRKRKVGLQEAFEQEPRRKIPRHPRNTDTRRTTWTGGPVTSTQSDITLTYPYLYAGNMYGHPACNLEHLTPAYPSARSTPVYHLLPTLPSTSSSSPAYFPQGLARPIVHSYSYT